jgi:hypothetical protein
MADCFDSHLLASGQAGKGQGRYDNRCNGISRSSAYWLCKNKKTGLLNRDAHNVRKA